MVFCRFDGRIVAKLPFVPIPLLQGLSHRNIRGDDYTDCSFIFFYILCTMSIRQVGIFGLKLLHLSSLYILDCKPNILKCRDYEPCLTLPISLIQSYVNVPI